VAAGHRQTGSSDVDADVSSDAGSRVSSGSPAALGSSGVAERTVDVTIVLVLLALAAWLRVSALAPSSLWLDDAWIALVSRSESFDELIRMSLTAPGFGATLAALIAVLGLRSWVTQLPAFVAGVALAPATYVLLRRRGIVPPAAVVGGAALLASPIAIAYAGRVKAFSVDALVTLVVLGLAWRLVSGGGRRTLLALTGVGIAGTMFSAAVAPAVVTTLTIVALAVVAARSAPAGWLGRGLTPRIPVGVVLGGVGGYLAFAGIWYVTILVPAVNPGLRNYWSPHFIEPWPLERGVATTGDAAVGLLEGFLPVPWVWSAVALALGVAVIAVTRPWLTALLLAPVATAVVAAALELAPLGGGRTDLYLYPTLALVLAVGVHELRHRWVVATVAAVALLALIPSTSPATYPAQDIAPLVAQVEADLGPEDRLVVYPSTRWAFALYTSTVVRFEFNDRTANGYEPVFTDERFVVLEPQRVDHPEYRSQLEERLDDADRVWHLASHWRRDLRALERDLELLGWHQVDREERPGAQLVQWRSD
jgi:hypothetical protein